MLIEKEERRDLKSIKEAGKILLQSGIVTHTATTVSENCKADITATTTANTELLIEVKTVKKDHYYRHQNIRISDDVLGNGHIQVLNKDCNGGTNKYEKFEKGEMNALVYYVPERGKLYFLTGEQVLGEANRGDCWIYHTHNNLDYFDDGSRRWEKKAVMDLDKAICIDL